MSYVSLYSSLIASALFVLFLILLFYALTAAGYWLVFTKARQPYWHALISFYNIYTQYKISWDFLPPQASRWQPPLNWQKAFGRDTAFAIGLFFLGPVFMLLLG